MDTKDSVRDTEEPRVLLDPNALIDGFKQRHTKHVNRYGRATAIALSGARILMLLLALAAVLAAVVFAINSLGDFVRWAVRSAASTKAPHLIVDPVTSYITAHSAGLPISAHDLQITWALVGLVLLVGASGGVRGAQLTWPLYGIANVAMVWAGTPSTAARPVVAGLAGAVWALLSLIALARHRTHRPIPASFFDYSTDDRHSERRSAESGRSDHGDPPTGTPTPITAGK